MRGEPHAIKKRPVVTAAAQSLNRNVAGSSIEVRSSSIRSSVALPRTVPRRQNPLGGDHAAEEQRSIHRALLKGLRSKRMWVATDGLALDHG